MAWINICKYDRSMIRVNFRGNEFYSKSGNYGFSVPDCHKLDEKLLDAAQFIREFTNVPWTITSSFRTLAHNRSIGSADTSLHVSGRALDLQPLDNQTLRLVVSDIATKGPIYAGLRQRGINGFGIYDSFIHIDTRNNFTAWDKSGRSSGLPRVTTASMNCVAEPEWEGLNYEDLNGLSCSPEESEAEKKNATWIGQILEGDSEDGIHAHSFKFAILGSISVLIVMAVIVWYKLKR